MHRMLLIFAAAIVWAQAQPSPPKTERDLKFDNGQTKPPSAGVTVPRSYALVVGISQYKNLPPEGQLKFPERDAASIYTVLISAEGGQFEPANVHKLIG